MRVPARSSTLLVITLLALACNNDSSPVTVEPVPPSWSQVSGGVGEGRFNAVWGTSIDSLLAPGADHAMLRHASGRWSAEPVPPSASALRGIWGRREDDVFSVGENGLILHFDGTGWATMTAGANSRLNDVWGAPPNVYAAATDVSSGGGRVLRYDGTSWATMTGRFDNGINTVWADARGVFVAGDAGYLARFDGTTWTPLVPITGSYAWHDAWGVSSTEVFFVGDDGQVAHYLRGATTITSVGTAALRGVYGFAANDVWAVGDAGTLAHYDGTGWTTVPAVTTNPLRAITGFADGNAVAVGDFGTVLVFENGTWRADPDGHQVRYNDIWAGSATDVIAVGRAGGSAGVMHHLDGREWPASYEMMGVFGFAPDDVTAVGRTGTIVHFDGTDWTPMTSGTGEQIFGISGADDGVARRLYAVGTRAMIRFYNGTRWAPMVAPGGSITNLTGVYAAAPDNAFAIGEQGTVFRYRGPLDAIQWTRETLPAGTETLTAIAGRNGNDVFIVSALGHIFHYDGTHWSDVVNPSGAPLLDLSLARFHEGLAVGTPRTILYELGGGFVADTIPFLGETRTVWAGDHVGYVGGSQGAILRVQW